MTLVAGMLAVAAARGGALVWAGITYVTGYQIGWMAIGVGALVGAGARYGGGEGKVTALFAGGLSIVAMLFGNVLAVQVALDRAIADMAEFALTRESYEAEFAMADQFVLYTTEENYAAFVFENTYYTEAESADGVTQAEIQEFLTDYAPDLRRLHQERPSYDVWKARKHAELKTALMEGESITQFVIQDIGIIGVVFMALGVVAAMRVVGEWD